MGVKEQLIKLKENWLLLVLIVLVIGFLNFGSSISFNKGLSSVDYLESRSMSPMVGTSYYLKDSSGAMPMPIAQQDFAPEVKERKITKAGSLSIEAEQGNFKDVESKLKSIVLSTDSYLLSENVNKYDSGWKSYYNGYYQIKVDTRKYSTVVAQLKGIGEVKSFNENAEDITGSYTNVKIEIESEKAKLDRYNQMYKEAALISDKLQLNDRMFEQERKIKYLEDSLSNIDTRVDYSTINVRINEKQSEYVNVVFVKFSELIKGLVSSLNTLLRFIFIIAPWAIFIFAVRFIKNLLKRKLYAQKPEKRK